MESSSGHQNQLIVFIFWLNHGLANILNFVSRFCFKNVSKFRFKSWFFTATHNFLLFDASNFYGVQFTFGWRIKLAKLWPLIIWFSGEFFFLSLMFEGTFLFSKFRVLQGRTIRFLDLKFLQFCFEIVSATFLQTFCSTFIRKTALILFGEKLIFVLDFKYFLAYVVTQFSALSNRRFQLRAKGWERHPNRGVAPSENIKKWSEFYWKSQK